MNRLDTININRLHKRRHLGAPAEAADFVVSLVNFPGTLATCATMASILGLAAFGPFIAVGVMLVLAGLGTYYAINHYLKSKEVVQIKKDVDALVAKNASLKKQDEELQAEVNALIQSIKERSGNNATILNRINELLDLGDSEVQSEDNKKHKFFMVNIVKKILKKYDEIKKEHPKKVLTAKIALNVSLGLFSAVGLVGTVGFFMGISTLGMLATPLGIGLLIVGAALFIGMNIAIFHFHREKLSSHYFQSKEKLAEAKFANTELENSIEMTKNLKEKLVQEFGDSVSAASTVPLLFSREGVNHSNTADRGAISENEASNDSDNERRHEDEITRIQL